MRRRLTENLITVVDAELTVQEEHINTSRFNKEKNDISIWIYNYQN